MRHVELPAHLKAAPPPLTHPGEQRGSNSFLSVEKCRTPASLALHVCWNPSVLGQRRVLEGSFHNDLLGSSVIQYALPGVLVNEKHGDTYKCVHLSLSLPLCIKHSQGEGSTLDSSPARCRTHSHIGGNSESGVDLNMLVYELPLKETPCSDVSEILLIFTLNQMRLVQ